MKKVYAITDILESAASSGKLPRPLKTICEFDDATFLLKEILHNGSGTTIQKAVAEFFKKNKFTVKEEGIGWRISK